MDRYRIPYSACAVCAVIAVVGVGAALLEWVSPLARAAAYAVLMLCPGGALYLFVERDRTVVPFALSAFAASPVLIGAAGGIMMLAGMPVEQTARMLVIASVVIGAVAVAWHGRDRVRERFSARNLIGLAAMVVVFCLIAGYLPLTREWMRYWSDAWFHAAVIAQISDYGIPPEDPYFVGLALQYMWFYHVVIIIVAQGANIDPMVVMPLLNLQGLVTFILATFLLSVRLRKRFVYGTVAVIVVMLGINALFWVFLPLKLVRAFIGDVRGWSEVARTFTPVPLDMYRGQQLLNSSGSSVLIMVFANR